MKKKFKKGNAYLIEYLDAAYSYNLDILKREIILPTVISLGIIRDFNVDYVNLVLITQDDGGESLEGLIIPRKAIVDVKLLKV